MSRWSSRSWQRPTDPALVEERRAHDADRDFWEWVDSQAAYSDRIPNEWRDARGDACLALRTDGVRCLEPSLGRVPFCAFHFDKAWTRIEAFVADERVSLATRMADWERRSAGVDVAMVLDAKRALARQPERIYFYACEAFVKIGRSIKPEQRIRTLGGTKAPEGIDVAAGELLGTMPGGSRTETALHRRFASHRVVGEWFTLAPIEPAIRRLIAEAITEPERVA